MIINPEKYILDENYASCTKLVSDYFIKRGVPLFSIKDNRYIFKKTKKFLSVYGSAPFYIKMVVKL